MTRKCCFLSQTLSAALYGVYIPAKLHVIYVSVRDKRHIASQYWFKVLKKVQHFSALSICFESNFCHGQLKLEWIWIYKKILLHHTQVPRFQDSTVSLEVKVQKLQLRTMDWQSQSSFGWFLCLRSFEYWVVSSIERASVYKILITGLISGIYEAKKMRVLETKVSFLHGCFMRWFWAVLREGKF